MSDSYYGAWHVVWFSICSFERAVYRPDMLLPSRPMSEFGPIPITDIWTNLKELLRPSSMTDVKTQS